MPAGPRPLSNNVRACLEDIEVIAKEIVPDIAAASSRAEDRYQDHLLLANLNAVSLAIIAILHHCHNARANVYRPLRRRHV